MRIAYVEDNPTNLALVERVASMNQHVIVSYNEGEIAQQELLKEKVDLILMDVELAGEVSGLQVVKYLRANGLQTPIVAVTAYAMMGDRDKCIEAGCNDYLPKPLPINELLSLLSRYEKSLGESMSADTSKPVPAPVASVPAAPTAPASESVAATPASPEVPASTDASPAATTPVPEPVPAPVPPNAAPVEQPANTAPPTNSVNAATTTNTPTPSAVAGEPVSATNAEVKPTPDVQPAPAAGSEPVQSPVANVAQPKE